MLAIRRASFNDSPTLAELDASCTFWPWSEQGWIDSIVAGHEVSLLTSNEEVVGASVFMCCAIDEAELLNLLIKPSYRQQRAGSYLLNHGLVSLSAHSVRRVFLEVRESNLPARGLYEKHGFSPIGVRQNYYPLPTGREHAILMEKRL